MKYGDKVLVHIPEDERKTHTSIAAYHGRTMIIRRRVTLARAQRVYYELYEAESEYGVPFGFVQEWLMPIREEERKNDDVHDQDES